MVEPVLITGCQRSGTTLMNLIFDSHPAIRGIDEVYFRRHFTLAKFRDLLASERDHALMSFKLPMQSHEVDRILNESGSRPRVVWMVRDPRAVVASMVELHLPINKFVSVSWAASFIHKEIINVLQRLPADWLEPLEAEIHRFRLIENVPSILRPAEDIYFTAALCWRLKLLTLRCHQEHRLPCRIVPYERLVRQPAIELRELFDELEIAWNDRVLAHHEHARVDVIGGTRREKPISSAGVDKWRQVLSTSALRIVEELCGEAAADLGYDFSKK